MGSTKKDRKKYATPSHPWQKERIDAEKILTKKYGLRNKKEIWRLTSLLGKFKKQAKKLSALDTKQSKLETTQLFDRLKRYNLISEETFDSVLGLGVESLMERRLQTVLVNKHLARTTKQARQMITHNHVRVGAKVINSPSYLVKINEEDNIEFKEKSGFSDEKHPERFLKQEEDNIKEELKEISKPSDTTEDVKETTGDKE